ncbi:hypothetical protein [Sphingobacterium cellulitidis]|uniref:Uncharacterized protein n=1 Tax=Sphingobacterium cellulitidis TaxID=1768011 RepID=A0A8H9G155_9SPHI|nr:hypothetical protein [Sphingobacterium soli]MBA8985977.1 hypothetical protein [Sphingobacterium soli]GGE28180.1 hypothetical protein GCM10011516_27280 [Sphingobacterium soli]
MAKQSKARQQSLDFLDQLGTSKTEFTSPSKGLEGVCADFIGRVIDNIQEYNVVDTGKIEDLNIEVINSNHIAIWGQSYINFIDEGVNGVNATPAPFSPYRYKDKMPDPKIFEDWIKSKNIKVRNTRKTLGKGKNKVIDVAKNDIKKVAFAMARDRFLNGAEPKPIFKKEIPKLIQDAENQLINITIDDICSNLNL